MDEFISYFNGNWVKNSEIKIDFFDRGFTMGDAVFDVERTFNGKIFRLEDHISRLFRSLKFARINPKLNEYDFIKLTHALIKKNEKLRKPGQEFVIRQTITRGVPSTPTQGNVTEELSPTIIIMISLLDLAGYAESYLNGAKVIFPNARTYNVTSLDPKFKNYSRGNYVQAQIQGADIDPEAYPVLLDHHGNITENIGANFFIVTDGKIRTPKGNNILHGISRKVVFELAHQANIPITEDDLQPYDAYTADEVFLSNTFFQVLPIKSVDNRLIKNKCPGPITNQILGIWSELVGLDIVDQSIQQSKQKSN